MPRYTLHAQAPKLSLVSIRGAALPVPDPSYSWTHLQFRRFAGCPICNLHIRTFAHQLQTLEAASIKEIIFFHSTAEDMLPYQGQIPMDCIADPEKTYYKIFGVETSILGVLDPRNLLASFKGLLAKHPKNPAQNDPNGALGMPADILIDKQGRIVALKYGRYADDQWTVEELLAIAQELPQGD